MQVNSVARDGIAVYFTQLDTDIDFLEYKYMYIGLLCILSGHTGHWLYHFLRSLLYAHYIALGMADMGFLLLSPSHVRKHRL